MTIYFFFVNIVVHVSRSMCLGAHQNIYPKKGDCNRRKDKCHDIYRQNTVYHDTIFTKFDTVLGQIEM